MKTNSHNPLFFYSTVKIEHKGQLIERRVAYAGVVENNKLIIGEAVCSEKDQFCKKLGRTIALGRVNKHPLVKLDLSNRDDTKIGTVFVNFCKNLNKLI